jgi:hypothetical protein
MRTMQLVRLNLELMEAWTWRENSGRHARSFRKRPMSAVRAERSVIQTRRRIQVGLGPFPRTGGALRALPAVSSRLAQFVNRSILALAIRRQDRVKSAGHLSIGPYAERRSALKPQARGGGKRAASNTSSPSAKQRRGICRGRTRAKLEEGEPKFRELEPAGRVVAAARWDAAGLSPHVPAWRVAVSWSEAIACWIPARGDARVDPMVAFTSEMTHR